MAAKRKERAASRDRSPSRSRRRKPRRRRVEYLKEREQVDAIARAVAEEDEAERLRKAQKVKDTKAWVAKFLELREDCASRNANDCWRSANCSVRRGDRARAEGHRGYAPGATSREGPDPRSSRRRRRRTTAARPDGGARSTLYFEEAEEKQRRREGCAPGNLGAGRQGGQRATASRQGGDQGPRDRAGAGVPEVMLEKFAEEDRVEQMTPASA